MGLHSLNSTLSPYYIVIVLKRKKKKWKNVSVRSEDPLCMMWKLITPRKYSFRFQSSHNLLLPLYLTSNFHSPVSLLHCRFEIQPARRGMGQDLPLVKSNGLTQTPRFTAWFIAVALQKTLETWTLLMRSGVKSTPLPFPIALLN